MIGIGIIGAGRISGAHARAAASLPQTRLAAVAEPDEERRAAFGARYGGTPFADTHEMLECPDVDAVVVALPHWLHAEVSCAALEAGKHVLLEKPMAMTVAECDAMIAAARRTGRKLMVGHSQHFFPVNQAAKALLDSGELGRIVMATDTWFKPFFGREKRPPWFLDTSRGGGMWPMNGSHMIDRMTMFIGSDVVAVKAMVGTYFFDQPATDAGLAFLQFRNGVCATLAHAGYRDHCGVDRFEGEITATEGQIRFTTSRLWRSRDDRYEEVDVLIEMPRLRSEAAPGEVAAAAKAVSGAPPTFALQMAAFADCILNDTEPPITGEYGREIVRVLNACEESGRTGREVRLDIDRSA
jgi:phthalate 4,5-cis-dihydrodiol dehydrogenase